MTTPTRTRTITVDSNELVLRTINSIEERPFTSANVARFRSIGYITLTLGFMILAKDLYLKGWNTFIILNVDGQGVVTNLPVCLPFLLGLLALILAEIFKLGYQIYEENRLTI